MRRRGGFNHGNGQAEQQRQNDAIYRQFQRQLCRIDEFGDGIDQIRPVHQSQTISIIKAVF